jgi:hypothetical protein
MSMMLTKIRPGQTLPVPAGADLCRSQAYAVRVLEIYGVSTDLNGHTSFFVRGERLRLDGAPTRRKGKTLITFVRPEAARCR